MRFTELLKGQVPDQWLANGGHNCPVCSRLISTSTRVRLPSCHPAFNNPVYQFMERSLP